MGEARVRPRFTEADLRASFAARDLRRGREYAERGLVEGIDETLDGDVIYSLVRGREEIPYAVEIRLSPDRGGRLRIVGECSCPVGENCKHAAATAYVMLERFRLLDDRAAAIRSAASAGAPRRARGPAAPADEVDPRVRAWLQNLESASTTLDAGSTAAEESIAYVFSTEPIRPTYERPFPFEVLVVRRLKSGQFAKVRDCTLQALAVGTARAVSRDDALIGRLLGALLNSARDRASLYDDALERVVATGRAFAGSPASVPLRLTAPRAARLEWTVASDGRQRPKLRVEGEETFVLRGYSPWFVDERLHTIGRVETEIPPGMLALLLDAPPLSAADARLVGSTFAKKFPQLHIPAPLAVTEKFVAVAPVPTLTLRSVELPGRAAEHWRNAPVLPQTIDIAELTFAYGGIEIDPDAALDEVRCLDTGVTIVHPRSQTAEREALERILRYGFEPDAYSRTLVPSKGVFLRLYGQLENTWPVFSHRGVTELRGQGWQTAIDPSFRHHVVDVTSDDDAWHPLVEEGSSGWFDVSIDLDVDGKRIPLLPVLRDMIAGGSIPTDAAELDAWAPGGTYYVQLGSNGITVAFPADRLKAILRTLVELGDANGLTSNGRLRLSRARAGIVDRLEASSALRWDVPERVRTLAEQLRGFDGIERVPVPKGFAGKLRPYQRDGLDWLQFLREFGFGGILADDMGLGKSVQTIAHILCEKESGRLAEPALLVVPTSLVFNWCDEFARFAPSLRTVTLHGAERAGRIAQLADRDVAITTYALLARDSVFAERSWHLVVLDEAQFLKNPQSKAALVAMRLRSEHRIALTGTPVENHLGDLWSLFSIALPGALGDRAQFGRLFRTPIEKRGDTERERTLAERIRPFVLRRTKENVASELPEKTEIVRRVELAGAQRDLYETVRIAMHERVQEEIARSGLARSQIVILDALLKLRQVCCDPRLLPERFKTSAGSVKLELLFEMLPEMLEEGRRILLFSQFTSMLDLIAPELEKRAIAFSLLTGGTKDRAGAVKRFESGRVPIFLISLKAGGTGLNLTTADTVIHYDPWWNPAVERQATDRAHRIGQTQRVFVYKLIGAETVEEKILDLQLRKAQLAAAIFAEKPTTEAHFAREDIERLFSPLG